MRMTWRWLSILLAAGFTSAAEAAPEAVTVSDSLFEIRCDAEGPPLPAKRVRFNRAVLAAAYDASHDVLFASLARRTAIGSEGIVEDGDVPIFNDLVAYDLARDSVLWRSASNELPEFASRGIVAVRDGKWLRLLDGERGRRLRKWNGRASLLTATAQLLQIENGRLTALSLPGLIEDWQADFEGPAKRVELYWDGQRVYLIADALTAVEPLTGNSWTLDAALRRRTPLGARFTVGRYEVTGLGSRPVEAQGDLFFAADSEAFRLRPHNGMARWRWALDFDPREKARRKAMGLPVSNTRNPGEMLLIPGASDLAVVSTGAAMLNGYPVLGDPPAIVLLDLATGRWLRGARIDTTRYVSGYFRAQDDHYVLGDLRRVSRYDARLAPKAVWEAEYADRPVSGLIAGPAGPLAIAKTDLVRLDPLTLQETGRLKLGAGGHRITGTRWIAGSQALIKQLEDGSLWRYPRHALAWRHVESVELSLMGNDVTLIEWDTYDGLVEPGP